MISQQHLPGTHTVASHRGNLALGVTQAVVGTPVLFEGFESEPLAITVVGDWARSTEYAHTGMWSFRSAAISDGQLSDADITVPVGAEAVSLWYRVDSELGFDFFRVLADGNEIFSDSGFTDWTEVSLDLTGVTILTLRYEKDFSSSSGEDAAWVDDITFTTATVDPEYRALTVDDDDRLRVVNEPAVLGDLGSPYAFTGPIGLADDTYRGFSVVVTVGPVLINGISVPEGFVLTRSGEPGEKVPGVDIDATGGQVVIDLIEEV